MKEGPQRGSFQVISYSVPPSPMSKICGVFTSKAECPYSAFTLLGVMVIQYTKAKNTRVVNRVLEKYVRVVRDVKGEHGMTCAIWP